MGQFDFSWMGPAFSSPFFVGFAIIIVTMIVINLMNWRRK